MFGERLKQLRREKNLKQEDLANIIGISKSSVSHYETDKDEASDKVKLAIARYFNVSMDYLFGIIDEPVAWYHQDKFIRVPVNMNDDEKNMLLEFMAFLEYRGSRKWRF